MIAVVFCVLFALFFGPRSRHLNFLAHLLVQLQSVRSKWTCKHQGKHHRLRLSQLTTTLAVSVIKFLYFLANFVEKQATTFRVEMF